ncbi:fungal specific transcription factor [Aspergillus nomiae NRRL 13137]|uniref:Fungal specific transcription factor n=1 Tax=Aspergillus nomiae NRRL (strain ATCC 15546 / NRRL 13137 / CBS 260.88 / M93) TaxID=1509407 RepID=A0A0L1J295_ASPN3|nr:fungal specific transcription factor [Aspergillus nomiae NRRL 13137]KNG85528.1 fungal specific transcription factor [Aspergillus nomiae NRRL 13137]
MTSVFLERAICLVAAKDRTAYPWLRLATSGPVMTPRQFCSELYRGLVVSLHEGLETDRITRIRTLALMSLHCEGHEGAEAASMHLCQAIHQAQTVGLHLDRPGQIPGDSSTGLFWCLWTLDKMHACIGGRPVLFADRDIGIKKPGLKPSHARTAFDAWFAISDLLAHVISFYRPTSDHTVGWEAGFPTFEEIMGDDVREDLDFTTLGFLELFYHAVAILSCRYKLTGRPDGSKSSYIRQGLSAIRIHSIVATECSQDLPAIPIVPYALTLSMGVSYQQFRSSKLITHSDRAKASLEACCTLLEALGISWCSAEAMARLGRKALHQIDGLNLGSHKPSQASTQPPAPGNMLINSTSAQSAEPVLHLPSYQSDDYPFNDLSATKQASPTQGSLDPPENNMQVCETDGLADIDVLFGDFLDLSLPTNFWDPVFLP